MKATKQQRQQIEQFFSLVRDHYDDMILHPVVDEKTGTERLAVCVVDRATNTIYVLGLLFLPYDSFYERFSLKQVTSLQLRVSPWSKMCNKLKKIVSLLWV